MGELKCQDKQQHSCKLCKGECRRVAGPTSEAAFGTRSQDHSFKLHGLSRESDISYLVVDNAAHMVNK